MMVVELCDINLPVDSVLRSVFNSDWEISTIVESAEFRGWDLSSLDSSCDWLLNNWFLPWLAQRGGVSSNTLTLLGVF